MASDPSEPVSRLALPAVDVTEGAWPGEDPECLMCQLTPEEREEVERRTLEGEDMYLIDDKGHWYPVELRHVAVGPKGLNEMLGLVKQDARAAAREGRADHSHTSVMKPR